VTVSVDAEADDVLVALMRSLARLGVVVSILLSDGSVVDGVPTAVSSDEVLCLGWDGESGERTDEAFRVHAADVAGIVVL
jgi:hypothetical protein